MDFPFTFPLTIGSAVVAEIDAIAVIESSDEVRPGATAAEWTVAEICVRGVDVADPSKPELALVRFPDRPTRRNEHLGHLHDAMLLHVLCAHRPAIDRAWGGHTSKAVSEGRRRFTVVPSPDPAPGSPRDVIRIGGRVR